MACWNISGLVLLLRRDMDTTPEGSLPTKTCGLDHTKMLIILIEIMFGSKLNLKMDEDEDYEEYGFACV